MARSTDEERSCADGVSKPTEDDAELEARFEAQRVAWVRNRSDDEASARALGLFMTDFVRKLRAARDERRPRNAQPGTERTTESTATGRHAALIKEAEAMRKRMHGVRHKDAKTLKAAVGEQCAAEFGALLRCPYSPDHPLFIVPWETSDQDREARERYTELRKAITAARKFSFDWEGRSSSEVAKALHVLRGLLPVLPDLTQPPFTSSPIEKDRAAFVRKTEGALRDALGWSLKDSEMGVLTLLAGFCPMGGKGIGSDYSVLLKKHPRV